MIDEPMLRLSQVAEYLSVHPNTVRRIHPLDLPFFRVGNRGDRRYRPQDVERYLKARRGREPVTW